MFDNIGVGSITVYFRVLACSTMLASKVVLYVLPSY